MIAAMKAKDAERLLTIRMMKSAFKNKEIEKREPITDAEAYQVLTTMIKQRRDSIDQFTKGNRPELAANEAAQITLIEEYMPKAASEEDIRAVGHLDHRRTRRERIHARPQRHGHGHEGCSGADQGSWNPRGWQDSQRGG